MKMKQIISLLLSAVMVLGIFAGCGNNQYASTEPSQSLTDPTTVTVDSPEQFFHQNPEIVRAVKLGIVPSDYLSDPTENASVNDVIELFGNVICAYDASKLTQWQELVNYSDQDAITAEAVLAAYYSASLLTEGGIPYTNGANCYGFGDEETIWHSSLQWGDADPVIVENSSERVGFYNLDEVDSLVMNDNWTIAMGYAVATYSYYSNQGIIPVDFENQTYHLNDVMTHEQLALIVVRFHDSFPAEPNYVLIEEIAESSTITADDIKNAAEVPAVDENGHSAQWVGTYNQIRSGLRENGWCPSNDHVMSNYYESDFVFMKEHGINYVRIQYAIPSLTYPDMPEDRNYINMNMVEELDQVIKWGMEYGIHVSICFQSYLDDDTDGLGATYEDGTLENFFTPDFQASDESWAMKERVIAAFAERYRDIPAANLSFELQNETASYVPEGYDSSELADKFISLANVVWAVDEDRALSLSTSEPLWDDRSIAFWTKIAQAGINLDYHCYEPAFCFSDPLGDMQEEELVWPYVDRDGVVWDMERVYMEYVAPWKELAETYGVGFKLGECGIFGGELLVYQQEHVVAWAEDFKNTMREHGVVYVLGSLSGYGIRNAVVCDFVPTWGESGRYREGAEYEMITYDLDEYSISFFYDPQLTKALFE